MHDRGMIKWMPFNSVINSKIIVNEIEYEKKWIPKPILSSDQINTLEEKIKDAYYAHNPVNITIYNAGYFKEIKDNIIKLDNVNKMIYFKNNYPIYFNEIINIK